MTRPSDQPSDQHLDRHLDRPRQWFDYPIRVQPHHTDYGDVVWHGTYVTWLESARVEGLRATGVPFDKIVSQGYDLPVVERALRCRKPLTLGKAAIVKTRLEPSKGIRLNWQYEIWQCGTEADVETEMETFANEPQLCLTGTVTLVTVDIKKRQVVRRLPREVKDLVAQLEAYFAAD